MGQSGLKEKKSGRNNSWLMTDVRELTVEERECIEKALGLQCDKLSIGGGGEGYVFRAIDTVMRGNKAFALKLFKPGKNSEARVKHMKKTFAQLGRIFQEFDAGTVHLASPLLFFDLLSKSHSQRSVTEAPPVQKPAPPLDPNDERVLELLESSRRPGFAFEVVGIDCENETELKNASSETDVRGLLPDTAIKVHFPRRNDPPAGDCCMDFIMAVVMELYDNSLFGVLTYMEQQQKGPTEKNAKLEAAVADIRKWPWKVKLQTLCGVLMMRQATGTGHGDFKPKNILFKMCHNTVWWTRLLAAHFSLSSCLFSLFVMFEQ